MGGDCRYFFLVDQLLGATDTAGRLFLNYAFDRPGNGVRTGHDLHPFLPNRRWAANPLELFDDILDVHTRTQGSGNQSAGRLALRWASSMASSIGKHLANALVIIINRNIQFAASDLTALSDAIGHLWAGPR